MRTVWKFELPLQDAIIEVEMPKGAQILHVGKQGAERIVYLWALVESDADKETRRFRIHGTGHPLANNAGTGYNTYDTYVGTAIMLDGMLVWHVFEVK